MDCSIDYIDYSKTNYFSKIITDYLDSNDALKPFIDFSDDFEGIKKAIENRKLFPVDRKTLVDALKTQYKNIHTSAAVQHNLELLLDEKTFTVVTAHQPNILTGHLYFIYKILHAIKLCAYCKIQLPEYNFIPVFFMGSEDADLEELNHIFVDGKKYTWQTDQKGAVGRMLIDKNFIQLVNEIKNQVAVLPYGEEMIQNIQQHYQLNTRIDFATASFVNELFGHLGLITLIPDDYTLKSLTRELFKKELLTSPSYSLVHAQNDLLTKAGYKNQAHARNINLFYLTDGVRNRIERENNIWNVVDTTIQFNQKELEEELENFPERFSPNVILRGAFQEAILPNIAFIGGGGELAYWLQLKQVFAYFHVFYPVLVLRNSFLIIEKKSKINIDKTGLQIPDLFKPTYVLTAEQVHQHTKNNLSVQDSLLAIQSVYNQMAHQANQIDTTLNDYVERIKNQTLQQVSQLEKKLEKAEKRNQQDRVNQIEGIKNRLFPMNSLQERVENIIPFWSRYGKEIINAIYQNSLSVEQKITVLTIKDQTDL